ncbi:MAG TPA: C69 family dipeptidase [Bacteroidales bacterium]|nr:C69 family dipeptidase [Bacteroidales bacterium]
MKKSLIIITFGLLLTAFAFQSNACTNFIISKGASVDGSTMITYAADSHVLYGELYYRPAADYPEGAMMDVYEWDTGKYLGKIKQVRHTYSVVGNMNEYQVAIGETTYGGREDLQSQPDATMDYGSLMYITLQRAKTAREAIKIFGELVAEYGYASEGESFSISDPNEVWILEMIGKGKTPLMDVKAKKSKKAVPQKVLGAVWVAQRIPDGYISGHANQSRISTFPLNDPENCIYSPDVISFARAKGYFTGEDKDFSFCDAYQPITFDGARFCEARVWAGFRKVNSTMDKYTDYAMGANLKNRMPLWIKPDHKLSVQDVMKMMRDHYEGTPMDMTQDIGSGPYNLPYRWRPMTWSVDGGNYVHERATSTQQTGFSFIAQSRNWLPGPIGGINWFGVDDTYSTVYTPMYCGMTKVPETYAVGNGSMMEFTFNSAFWTFNMVSNWAYTRYRDMIPEIQSVQSELENKYIANTSAVDAAALQLYTKDKALGIKFITDYSVNAGNGTVKRWQELYAYLFTKYMDGNIKTKDGNNMNPKVSQPGYGDEWLRRIVKETGNRYKVIENK